MPFAAHNTFGNRFQKGVSGNPGGKPKVFAEIQRLAREDLHAMYAKLRVIALEGDVGAIRMVVQISGLPLNDPSHGENDVPPPDRELTEADLEQAENVVSMHARNGEG